MTLWLVFKAEKEFFKERKGKKSIRRGTVTFNKHIPQCGESRNVRQKLDWCTGSTGVDHDCGEPSDVLNNRCGASAFWATLVVR